jgi:hypothetical protein
MTKQDAIEELRANINLNFAHAVLLCNDNDGYYTDLHGGHSGNCCCNDHDDFVWREDSPYTDEDDLDEI